MRKYLLIFKKNLYFCDDYFLFLPLKLKINYSYIYISNNCKKINDSNLIHNCCYFVYYGCNFLLCHISIWIDYFSSWLLILQTAVFELKEGLMIVAQINKNCLILTSFIFVLGRQIINLCYVIKKGYVILKTYIQKFV